MRPKPETRRDRVRITRKPWYQKAFQKGDVPPESEEVSPAPDPIISFGAGRHAVAILKPPIREDEDRIKAIIAGVKKCLSTNKDMANAI